MSNEVDITLSVNGDSHTARAEARTTLADFLRDYLALTGTHLGCEHGVCGACTVLLDGRSVRSCLLLAVQAQGHALTTIEGLADPNGDLHPVQQAFSEKHGLQCGFCTPGLILAACEYLADNPKPDTESARAYLSGNICRCTGYSKILEAVDHAASLLSEDRPVVDIRDGLTMEEVK